APLALTPAPPSPFFFSCSGPHRALHSFPTRRSSDLIVLLDEVEKAHSDVHEMFFQVFDKGSMEDGEGRFIDFKNTIILLTSNVRSEEHTSELQSRENLVCRLLLEKKKIQQTKSKHKR